MGSFDSFTTAVRACADELTSALWPAKCWVCGDVAVRTAPTACDEHRLEAGLAGARCRRCADALPPGIFEGQLCANCRRRRPRFRSVVAAFDYNGGGAREWILPFKHGGRRDLALPLAAAMYESVTRVNGAVRDEWLVPVPLHSSRKLDRGYDQAELLAREVAGLGFGRVLPVLSRMRATESQGAGDAPSRYANVRGAFRARLPRLPSSSRYWIVDDVVTTGATADACAREIARVARARGTAADVHVLCVARASSDG